MSDRHAQSIRRAQVTIARGLSTCGHTVVRKGYEEPCGRPSVGWRWYQDIDEHEDCLGQACARHQNAGGVVISGLVRELDRWKGKA